MKEAIHTLSNFTVDQIKSFTHEQASSCLEQFNKLNKLIAKIWQTFKLLDTDTRDERTLVLINNHASGSIIKSMAEFKAQVRSIISVQPLEEEKGPSQLMVFQTMAINYLEYNKYKTQLRINQSLVEDRVQALHSEQTAAEPTSECKIQ